MSSLLGGVYSPKSSEIPAPGSRSAIECVYFGKGFVCPITVSVRLFSLFPAQDALVNGLAAFKAFFHAVPEFDLLFTVLPAQQDNLIVHRAGEIQQADIEVFYLHTDGV